jgi:DNA processing protein
MNVSDARLCLLLHSIEGLGDRSLTRLFQHYGNAIGIWESRTRDWHSLGVAGEAIRRAIATRDLALSGADHPAIERQLDQLQRLGAEVISLSDPRYPVLLQTIYDPPPILYVLGEVELLQQAQIGMVGSRKASPAGMRAASQLSADCVRAGLHICSGLAVGIDQAAHRGALDAGGKTVAVMATGLDVIYPARHRELASELVQSGALVSEFPPGSRPLRHRFPQRNRIISGLSLGVLVVEAALRSGSLITARTAMEQGREVFALPWSMYHPSGRGALGLIRDGVKMVLGVEDILEELGPLYDFQRDMAPRENSESHVPGALSECEAQVLRLVGSEVTSVDELVEHSGLAIASVLATLSSLEIQRRIGRSGGGYVHC